MEKRLLKNELLNELSKSEEKKIILLNIFEYEDKNDDLYHEVSLTLYEDDEIDKIHKKTWNIERFDKQEGAIKEAKKLLKDMSSWIGNNKQVHLETEIGY